MALASLGFSSAGRDILGDDHIELTSVGVDIGSSTSHLVFSHLELERDGQRYVMTKRAVLRESDILLTPYSSPTEIDGNKLETFIEGEYRSAGVSRDEVDSGAVILTGTALLRENSRMIADLFAAEAGKFVAVSAGDRLEASLAAHGSGAVAASALHEGVILNVDIGGGTTKLTACHGGRVESVAAIEVGARLVAFDESGALVRLEDAARRMAARLNLELTLGQSLSSSERKRLATYEADRLFELVQGKALSAEASELMRTEPVRIDGPIEAIVFSGGVSEFIYEHQPASFGDLGHELAGEVRKRAEAMGVKLLEPVAGIRATVIGASQYTVQVSGNTIFVWPDNAVPVRNVPVVRPRLPLGAEIDAAEVARVLRTAVARLDLHPADRSVALAIEWEGSATFSRLDALSRGIVEAQAAQLAAGQPLVLVCDSDVGGLLGLHIREELGLTNGIVSIDGIELKEFDFIDVGSLIPASGAAPVVIKSLVFPGSHSG